MPEMWSTRYPLLTVFRLDIGVSKDTVHLVLSGLGMVEVQQSLCGLHKIAPGSVKRNSGTIGGILVEHGAEITS
jgi:hypothetical protein